MQQQEPESDSVILIRPSDSYLSSEHLAYSYYSISQSFVFVSSSRDRGLLSLTGGMLAAPLLVAGFNLYTDVSDMLNIADTHPYSNTLWLRVIAQVAIFLIDGLIVFHSWKFMDSSSVTLNCWRIAARDVWLDRWDESRPDDAAPSVEIEMSKNIGTVVKNGSSSTAAA